MAFEDFYDIRKRRGEEVAKQGGQEAQPRPEAAEQTDRQPQMVGIPASAEQPTKSAVDMSWWQSPNYAKAEQERQQQAMAGMVAQERRAKAARNAALMGDIARLGGQMWAKAGGAWMIPRVESQTAVANTKLQQLRDKHAADMYMYAQRLGAAKDADRKDAMQKEQARMALEKEQAATAAAAQQRAFDNAVTVRKMQNDKEANAAKMAIDARKMQNDKEANAAKMAIDARKMQNDANYRAQQIAIAKQRAVAYAKAAGNKAKKVHLVSGDKQYTYNVDDNVYNANMGALYELISADAKKTKLTEVLGLEKSIIGGNSSAAIKNVVSRLWQYSPSDRDYRAELGRISSTEDGAQQPSSDFKWDDDKTDNDDVVNLDNL